jgi:cytochrome P450/deferrochelatase/peroxidase EfeB
MAWLKYFDRIHALLAADLANVNSPLERFDFESLGSRNALVRVLTRIFLRWLLPALTFVLRQIWPNPRIGRVVLVTRAADVMQVLSDMNHFRVVYGPEMKDLGGGHSGVLAEDGAKHDNLRAVLRESLRREDFVAINDSVAKDAAALLSAASGRIDVIRDLITRTASEAACRYFGLTAHDPDLFGQWTMALSNQIFGDFTGSANVHRQAKIASAHLAGMIDDAIARVKLNNLRHKTSKRIRATLIDRLITDHNLPDQQVRATIIGLATAFVPTNTLAAGNIIEVLVNKPTLLRDACQAALDGNHAAMRAVLMEAGRLNPALSPGLWRHVPANVDPQIIGTKGWGRRQTRHGDLILACIPSALRDRRGVTDEESLNKRRWMMFGFGPHDCWGAELALAHLVPVFIALLRQPQLRCAPDKHGSLLRIGAFPVRLDMVYDTPQAKRAMIVATLPVRYHVPREMVERALDALGNPARGDVAETLRLGNRVHFASLSVIEQAPGSDRSILIFELSGDGDENELLELIAKQCFAWLAPFVAYCADVPNPEALAKVLNDAHVVLDQRPFGNTGLHFDGLAELSVADIARQERVASYARQVIDLELKDELSLNMRALGLLLRTRRLMRGDSWLALREDNRRLIDMAQQMDLRGAVLRPSRQRLAIADWAGSVSFRSGIISALFSHENRWIPLAAAAIWLGWVGALLAWWSPDLQALGDWALAVPLALVSSLALAVISIALPFVGLAGWLRWQESRDPIDERAASLEHVEAIARREDADGFAQNHIIAVMPFKPGLLRKLTFAFAMWGIRQAVSHFFRPGFVVTMGTIHKARWFRVPHSEQFVFLSNYDGSWESYLEDFITRAHEGQSAAWSHGVGFPPTRFLIWEGAANGDRFKRWVRLQQRKTRFWFSRFPHLTAQHIRNNAMIEDGLARASSDTDARAWLSCFGSAQREADELESQEVQSLVFNGLSSMEEASALLLRLPLDRERAGAWLSAVSGLKAYIADPLVAPPERWVEKNRNGSYIRLPLEARVLFGDRSQSTGGAILGFTAQGLEHFGFDRAGGLDSMPSAFRMTMAARARLLGDDPDTVDSWRFCDDREAKNGAHALLMLYGTEQGRTHGDLVNGHIQLLNFFGGSIVHRIDCQPAKDRDARRSLDVEPFGFRDGISQPVIRGTRRAAQGAPERDLVAAGEFLLGYHNHQGYLSPPVLVGAERDPACQLPSSSAARTNRYPWFGNRGGLSEPRDFGRNGTFLAVRQLDQDIAGFWQQAEAVSQKIRSEYESFAELAGAKVDKDWVAAKMIGRWPDGRPLVGNPDKAPNSEHLADPENDFAYGVDDPRGLACPLGAHIRRTNPRDSQEPGDEDEQRITNRHRLLRRGRAYCYRPEGQETEEKTGLLFIALCADLERQFEFVQRTWINATSFHGLVDERDPLLRGSSAPSDNGASGVFTIPTAAGPIRLPDLQSYVEMRGGGYFFLPSRSTMVYLVTQARR